MRSERWKREEFYLTYFQCNQVLSKQDTCVCVYKQKINLSIYIFRAGNVGAVRFQYIYFRAVRVGVRKSFLHL